jgi:hypothetical protein
LMVPNAQVTFEPHKCDIALMMRERSVHIAQFRTKKRGTMSPLLFFQNRSTLSQCGPAVRRLLFPALRWLFQGHP